MKVIQGKTEEENRMGLVQIQTSQIQAINTGEAAFLPTETIWTHVEAQVSINMDTFCVSRNPNQS